jgi:hypothetical protein
MYQPIGGLPMKSTRVVYSILAAICLVGVVATPPAFADTFIDTYISASGNTTNNCTITAPCSLLSRAVAQTTAGGVLHCLDSSDYAPTIIIQSITIDCSGTSASIFGLTIQLSSNSIVRLIGLEIRSPTTFQLSGELYIEKCKIFGGLMFEPDSAASLHVSDSFIDGAGVLLQPGSGGSATATFDRVKITNSTGGGIKALTTDGPVTVDITDSVVSNNGGNGLNAVGGAGGPAIFNIHNSVIANNGVAGVQVNGATAAAMIDTTLLDSNTSGATSVVGGGHVLTYGNNRIVGSSGSGFTGPAALQ